MAARTGTVQRRGVVGVREDLSDMIYNIDPTGFVGMMNLPNGPRVAQTYFEWQTDEDRAGNASNRVEEGRVTQFARPATTRRLGNYVQISEESLSVSGTMEAVTRIAGRGGRESTRLLMKKLRELQRDMELSFWRNGAASASTNVVTGGTEAGIPGTALASDEVKVSGSLRAFIKTNFKSVATAAGTSASGVQTAGPVNVAWDGTPAVTAGGVWSVNKTGTNPTLGNITESNFRELLVDIYEINEVDSYELIVGPRTKVRLSGWDGIATHTHNVSGTMKPVVADSIDVYVGDFHTVRIMPSRHVYPVDAFLMDWASTEIRYLRPVGTERIAKRGDSKEWLINVEYGFAVKNEKTLGAFTDINPTTTRT